MDPKWNADRDAKRLARSQEQLRRSLMAPASRAELVNGTEHLLSNVMSVALAVEALELLLIERGLLGPDELMDRIKVLAKQKSEQVNAAQATAEPEPQIII
jgi:hypothetical protein